MSGNTTIHDNFIRSILANKKIALTYLKNYLPASVSKRLNLTQLPDTYLSEDLKKSISDIVYSCQRKDSEQTLKVCLLIEHKSYPDKYTPVQIGAYIFSALQKQVQNNEPLSLVIPVLLYHGKGRWQYRTLAGLFDHLDDEWKQYLPGFEYIYNDLGTLSDEQVKALNDKFLAASILALKHSFEKEWIERNAVQLLLLAGEGPKGLQKGFIIYLYSRGKLNEKILDSLPVSIKSTIMNTLDIYIEKGRKEGMEKGIEKGMEKGKELVVGNLLAASKFTLSEIANFAGVTEAFVKKVRTTLKKNK
ncbi:MAG: Rpn family recombination-promoting nuclease/putative transposase [Niabella sp.]